LTDGPEDHAVLWAVGDGADGEPGAAALSERIAGDAPDRLIYLGDVYERGSAEEYARNYAPSYGRMATITAPVLGNHEWARRREGYGPYWTAVHGEPPPRFYSLFVAGWQILVLNSEEPCGPGTPQHDWLLARLEPPGAPRIVAWHRPRFSAGRHGDQADVAPLWDAVRGRAALVLSAHDHNLQRFHPMDGTTQVVAGAGGRSHYGLDRSWRRVLPRRYRRRHQDARLAFANDADDGALRLELAPGRIAFAFVSVDGRTLDEGEIEVERAPSRSAAA